MDKRIQVLKRVLGYRGIRHPDVPRFFIMSDEERLPDPISILSDLPTGSVVILRHYYSPNRETLAFELVKKAHARRIKVLIAGDEKLAMRCGADGVHLPSFALNRCLGKHRVHKPNWLLSAAVHSRKAARKARKIKADFVLISPVFKTMSHADVSGIGPSAFTVISKVSQCRAIALGGVDEKTSPALKASGLWGIAGISIFRR